MSLKLNNHGKKSEKKKLTQPGFELPTFSTTAQALNHWAIKTQDFSNMAAIKETKMATTRQQSIFMKIHK